ncbi:hypothetical protein [Vreelandella aquamarina]|uniref:Uncharacterized protein n=1 Tax=Vreelandella aquamarina TaxID=77097 RepID=A0A1N6D791_9GAMM|nr:hypothetical protein [Halomonas meridiana]SIN66660.1 hypothetical protein SAMN05878249_2180 [Halomonas meridiana]SIN79791.1 hypothetical protein SAMN05878438_3616 [Halomonas meridiana]SIO33706.1 hypothetical protein SAMN05878442_2427 [Halomonas meridiana]
MLDTRIKKGEGYDAIRKDLLICHQNRTWQVIQYSITIQTAFIAGWYYAIFEANKPTLAILATIFCFIIMHQLKTTMLRYSFLMNEASHALNRFEHIYDSDKKSPYEGAHKTQGRIMDTILIANATMFGFAVFALHTSL